MEKKFYRIDEIAWLLGVSKRTIYRMLAEGELLPVKIRSSIRVPVESVENYIKKIINKAELDNGPSK